jgi:hypothetical protein
MPYSVRLGNAMGALLAPLTHRVGMAAKLDAFLLSLAKGGGKNMSRI